LLCLAGWGLLPTAAKADPVGNSWYVDCSREEEGYGFPDHPWKTINRALSDKTNGELTVKEGDTILIEPGVCREVLRFMGGLRRPDDDRDLPKEPNHYVTLKSSVPGEKVVIDGTASSEEVGIVFDRGIKGITLQDFEIRNWSAKGIEVGMSKDITLERVWVHHNAQGILAGGATPLTVPRRLRILTSEIAYNGRPNSNQYHGIYLHSGTEHEIAYSTIHHNGDPNPSSPRGYGIHFCETGPGIGERVRGTDIHHNLIFGNAVGAVIGCHPEVQDNTFRHNVVFANLGSGLDLHEQSGGNHIHHNHFKLNGESGIRLVREAPETIPMDGRRPNKVRLNTFVCNGRAPLVPLGLTIDYYAGRERFDAVVFDRNTYVPADTMFGFRDVTSLNPTVVPASFSAWQSWTGQDVRSRAKGDAWRCAN
jgi:hypothetical protein